MKTYLSKRGKIRVISFALAAFLLVFGFWMQDKYALTLAKRQINHRYQAAFDEINAGLDNICLTLEKSKYASTPSGFCSLAGQLATEAGAVEMALSALPLEGEGVATVARFISKMGDYSLFLSKKTAAGEGLTGEERQNIYKLSGVAKKLAARLEETRTQFGSYESFDKIIQSSFEDAGSISELNTAFGGMSEVLSDTPTLIYDGPFSDHLIDKKPELLENKSEIARNVALKKAARALRVKEESLTFSGYEEGVMPSYIFNFSSGSIGVTKKGGYITYFRNYREIGEATVSYDEAVKKAESHVNSLGLGKFKSSYYFTEEGVCTVNFALLKGDTICYTDLIKVGVAMDNCEVLLYEARGYIGSHKERKLFSPQKSLSEAKAVLNSDLKVESSNMALIPSGGGNEIYCYEFYCKGQDDEELLIYINAKTLAEENILVLFKSDGGTLTK